MGDGNQLVTVVVTLPVQEQADLTALRLAGDDVNAKVAANRAALAVFAQQAKDVANGATAVPSTIAGLGVLLKKVCEMQARLWFDSKFGDP